MQYAYMHELVSLQDSPCFLKSCRDGGHLFTMTTSVKVNDKKEILNANRSSIDTVQARIKRSVAVNLKA